jgi:uncharacterized protein (DUF433 family)
MNATQTQYVEIRTNRAGQARAYLVGSRVRVQDVVILHERFGEAAEEIASSHLPQLTLAQVHGALAYFFEDPEAIWTAIREDHAFAMEMKRRQEATGRDQHDA